MEQSLQQILSRSLYTEGASIITKRTLQELLKFNRTLDGSMAQDRDQLIAIGDTIEELGKGLTVIHVVVLAMIEDHWNEFDPEWRKIWNDDFLTFCFRKYRRKPSTVRADLRAVRVFLLDKRAAPFGSIEVPVRDQTGGILEEDGKCLTQQVEWDVTKVDLSKLKVAVPLIEQGKMDPKMWSMLADEKVTSNQMIETIYDSHEDDPHPPQLQIRFRMEGPHLIAYQNGNEADLGELDWNEYYEDPYSFKHRALDKLLELLSLTLDEHVTLYREQEEMNDAYYKADV